MPSGPSLASTAEEEGDGDGAGLRGPWARGPCASRSTPGARLLSSPQMGTEAPASNCQGLQPVRMLLLRLFAGGATGAPARQLSGGKHEGPSPSHLALAWRSGPGRSCTLPSMKSCPHRAPGAAVNPTTRPCRRGARLCGGPATARTTLSCPGGAGDVSARLTLPHRPPALTLGCSARGRVGCRVQRGLLGTLLVPAM